MRIKRLSKLIFKNVWVYILILLIIAFFYQDRYSWEGPIDKTPVPSNQVVFVTVQQTRYGVQSSHFKTLLESLKIWNYNQMTHTVSLKFKTLLPSKDTNAVVIFDQGLDSFNESSQVLSINTFPYHYVFNKNVTMTLNQVNGKGDADISFGGKEIYLKPGQTYTTWSMEPGLTLVKTTVQDQGILDKSDFKILK